MVDTTAWGNINPIAILCPDEHHEMVCKHDKNGTTNVTVADGVPAALTPRLKNHHVTLHKMSHGYIREFLPTQYSPFVAAVISYTLPILPFCLAIAVFRHMKARGGWGAPSTGMCKCVCILCSTASDKPTTFAALDFSPRLCIPAVANQVIPL